jgi:hypothetical protein
MGKVLNVAEALAGFLQTFMLPQVSSAHFDLEQTARGPLFCAIRTPDGPWVA